MHDGRCASGSGIRAASQAATCSTCGQLARLVDLPELREPPHLPLEVAARPRKRRELGQRDVGGVDLGERVDEVEAERVSRAGCLEAGRKRLRDDVPVEVAHDVERHAEHGLVVADGDDLGQALEPGGADRILQPRLPDHVVGRGRERRAWGTAQHEPLAASLEQKGEVRAAAVADPRRGHRAGAEPVPVEERRDTLLDDQRGLRLVGHRAIVRGPGLVEPRPVR